MAVTTTLATTTLSEGVDASTRSIKVASTSGLVIGIRLFVDRELMTVTGLGVATTAYSTVNVLRGVDGTAASPHVSSSTITIGRGDQFFSTDPMGTPPPAVPVSPYINVLTGVFWFAQGDEVPNGLTNRWWQAQTTTYDQGPLGIRTVSQTPTAST